MALSRGRLLRVLLRFFILLTDFCYRQQDAPGYKPGLWACMTGSLIIILIVAVTDVHFYFANKKQAQGLKIIEPVDGVDSSVSLLPLRTYRECRVTDLTSAGQIPIHLLGGKLGCMHGWEVVLLYLRDMKDSRW